MREKKLKYIYGPVSSWRLGSSLGIDVISCEEKVCTFDCIYCQVGKTNNWTKRRRNIPVNEIIEEINSLSAVKIDYITFSGRGEPTLCKNLSDIVNSIKKLRKEKIAILTNSSLLYRDDVKKDLLLFDSVMAKLDAYSQKSLEIINKPMDGIRFETIVESIKEFRRNYTGKFCLQIMFMKENKDNAKELVSIAKKINPDEIQINTPLRPCSVKPLSNSELDIIENYFEGFNTISVHKAKRKKVKPISINDTLKRRGKI